ncbi:MAG: hypothetical protein IKS87_03675 [Lachnospiraceae bacterium]|nr:hypothetical protein [Lachnospiraceae bacterium]
MNTDYNDIINLQHPTSKKHPRMDAMNRAAQFAPFAALTGLDDAIEQTGKEHTESVQNAEERLPFSDPEEE